MFDGIGQDDRGFGEDEARSRSSEPQDPGSRVPGKTILVVDDERGARGLVRHALRRRYRVLEADAPDAALSTLERERVDLILLDLHFPLDTGSLSEGLRAFGTLRSRWAEVPVLIVTAHDDASLREALLARGARAYLVKPIDVGELTDAVRFCVLG